MEEKQQGLLLHSIPYLNNSHILKIFTQEEGLISIFTKKKDHRALASPFCIAEWVYKKRQSDMYTLLDGSLLDPLLDLRQSFASLSAAGSMAQDILKSQLPSQASPQLYALLCSYFKKIPQFKTPEILAISFRLKLLLHEGLLSLKPDCSLCSRPASILAQGESFCPSHAPSPNLHFTPEEWAQLHALTFASNFSSIHPLELNPSLAQKIISLEIS